jgi:AraC-like DNA-binding protein
MLADEHLDNFTLLRSRDLDETRALVADIFCDHRLTQLDRATLIDYRHWHAELPSVAVGVMKYGAQVRVEPREFQSFYLVQLPVSGCSTVVCSGREIMTHAGRASVHAPHDRITMEWSPDCHKTVVRIGRSVLERHLASLIGAEICTPIDFAPDMDVSDGMGATWMRIVMHLVCELQHNPLIASSPLVASGFEQLLMTSLLQAQPNPYRDMLAMPVRRVAPRHVRIAEEYIRAHADKPVSIEDLVRITGTSGRTLYSGFRRFLGKSPMQYLRDMRMENARRDLQTAPPALTVTEIATKWGFYQLGRFATEYKNRYGETPSVTRRRGN